MNGSVCSGMDTPPGIELNGTVPVSTGDEICYTPVTDPDSIALLAVMHEANRYVD